MRKIKYLIIHCTDTPAGRKVTKQDIEKWHLEERGWSRVGYSDMIHLDGKVENLIPYDDDNYVEPWEISNGARGFNSISRHVVYVGGKNNIDTRTFAQVEALEKYVRKTIENHPDIKVIGHNEVSVKTCPSFDVSNWLKTICIDSKHIGR